MDVPAKMTVAVAAEFNNADRTLVETGAIFDQLRATRETSSSDAVAFDRCFEHSLMLKGILDKTEEKVKSEPSLANLAIILNCEAQLFKLNKITPLRHNPFLSHWVETIQRMEKNSGTPSGKEKTANSASVPGKDAITTARICSIRHRFVRDLLLSNQLAQRFAMTPRAVSQYHDESLQTMSWNMAPFIKMLEEEGIYEKPPSSQGKADIMPAKQRQNGTQNLLSRLETSPETVVPTLTHLPIDLQSLDLLTTLIQNGSLEKLSVESSEVIRDYIQHSLRQVERMGLPASAAAVQDSEGTATHSIEQGESAPTHDREAQIRSVKLLLLFIRNLIRKALIPPEAIYFEIQEICVRYVWIREVREFRAFIEEGRDSGDT